MSYFNVRYVGPIGSGGLGTVDEVEVSSGDAHPIGTRPARKRLGPKWANDSGAQQRFDREIEIIASMSHPGIVALAGVPTPGQPPSYVMPRFPESLRDMLRRQKAPIDRKWVVSFGLKVVGALDYAHASGFIHRDLKPENILLDAALEPVIADRGVGQFIHQHSKVLDLQTVGPMGTPYYAPMEQWCSGRCEASGDVCSLGLVLAEMAAGKAAAIAPAFSGIRADVVRPESVAAQRFNVVLRRMTMQLAAQRYPSMGAVAHELALCA